jgi:hypothetical protein
MNFFMILKVALRAIFRNKTRSLLTALGIIVGIAAVIAVVAIGQGAQAMMIKEISSIGNNIIMVFPGSRTQGGVHGGSGSSQTLTAEDGENIAQDLAHLVRAVTPVVRTGSQVIYQENNWPPRSRGFRRLPRGAQLDCGGRRLLHRGRSARRHPRLCAGRDRRRQPFRKRLTGGSNDPHPQHAVPRARRDGAQGQQHHGP